MIVLTAYAQVKTGQGVAALQACEVVRQASVLEPGCHRYDYYVSPRDENQIVFVEEWSSLEDLQTHFQQQAFLSFMAAMGDLLQGEAEIRIFDAQPIEG